MADPTDFAGIPNRDASASIRGYVYQIYQSVWAWMLLGEDDVLILEGAEDFDVHVGPTVVATQVKHEARNVTLRSSAVVDAIQNFWTHQQSNQEFRVVLRFLTTGEAGYEKGIHFGTGVPGLEYWKLAAQGGVDCEPLRQFLITLSFDKSLLDFLRLASDEELRERMLANIQWDLGSRDKDALEANIENKLKLHGHKRGIGPHHSIRVLPHLLKQIADILSINGIKSLCFGDFLSKFEEATTEVIPRAALEAMQNTSGMHQLLSMQDNVEMARIVAMAPTLGTPIPMVSGAIGRSSLVCKVSTQLVSKRVVFLYGSSGVGKTNIALLVTVKVGGNWRWAGFRGRPADQIHQGLSRAAYEVEAADGPIQMVLDDLEFTQILRFERELIALIFAVTQRNGLVIVTSISRAPLHLFPKLWLQSECEVPIPYFDEAEVNELLATHGLSDSKHRDGWARIIFFSTSGHPQLVHARVRTLSAQGWPHVSYSDLTRSDDIERVCAEARQRLLQEFPSDSTRLLAYRLSVIIGAFSRRLALAIGAAPQSIQMAGEAFDHLVGPWIEREGEDSFRVSPLLNGAAENILPPNEIKAIHISIAHDYLSRAELNQYDVGTTFFHAFMAKDLHILSALASRIVMENSENIGLLYDAMAWFPHVSMGAGQKIVEGDTATDLMLRLVQFKLINGSVQKDDALKILDRMEEILTAMGDSDQRRLFEAMTYGVVLNTLDIYIPSQTVVHMLSRLMDTATIPGLEDIYEKLGRNSSPNSPRIADNRPEQIFFSYQAIRIRGLDDLVSLITALEGLPKNKRDCLLAVCNSDFDFASLLIGRAWWSEVQDGHLDVSNAIAKLQHVELIARYWEAMRLVLSCQVAISVIYDEYGNSAESALAVLDVADAEFPNSAELINQRSKVLFHANRRQEALTIAERALSFTDLSSVEYVYTCRNAGIAAADIGNWEQATGFFDLGTKRALQSNIQRPMGIGLMADAAIGNWMQGKRKECISKFIEVLDLLESIPFEGDIKLHHLHATVRHCISWVHFETKRERPELFAVPRPGMCSNQDPHEGIKGHRIIDIAASWLLLHQAEQATGVDCGVGLRSNKYSDAEQPLFIAGYKRTLDFESALRSPPWTGVVPALVRMQEVIIYSEEIQLHEQEDKGWQVVDIPQLPDGYWRKIDNCSLIYQALLAACINCLAQYSEQPFPISQWRQDLAALTLMPREVASFLDVLAGYPADGSLYQEVGAGLFALREGVVTAETLWKISFRLLNAFERWKRWVEEDIDTIITNRWKIVLETQSFAFTTPSLAIPTIKTACSDDARIGLARVATIVAATAPYLSIRISPAAKAMLERIVANKK